ncbi:hypothetical protein BC792_101112 [Sphingobacterium allocomposti]|jgi:hypothetical protein|uniref:Uncharacterized protein n=1 Tax=Sphingobacterium allocomposti TaxID=415956 RepID=A0A5S5DSU9_9SPHI|nr:hypothetical protein [Sphingobacterium composti Yoo et al. 2007 non Ten et al. 2007]TYP98458.1 hypothetical protein BC792_101112 [Sphingobacterium composti Yoo et al. 2007 non Ten et al. 2007]HLS96747.1 hypothetical protein [Sphingobacterium sp.]
MHQLTATYRSIIAYLLSAWMVVIIVSGVVFMHKEVTSTGEIITHVHPYDFTKKGKPDHHKSDAEIQYLNVVFAGAFVASDTLIYEIALSPLYLRIYYAELIERIRYNSIVHYDLRGPPRLA